MHKLLKPITFLIFSALFALSACKNKADQYLDQYQNIVEKYEKKTIMGRLPDVEIQHLETEIENLDDKTKIWEGNKDLSNKQELR